MIDHLTDKEIVQEILRSSGARHEAIGELYDRYHKKLRNYLRYRGVDLSYTEDLVQETFLIFYRRIIEEKLQIENITGYLYGVATNLTRDYFRKKLTNPTAFVEDILSEIESDLVVDPDQDWAEKERIQLILSTMQKKYPKCYDLMAKRYFDGWEFESIAIEFGYSSESVVRTKLSRCRKVFSEELRNNMELLGDLVDSLSEMD